MDDRPTVLVVEDDRGMRELLTSYLIEEFEVITAPNGEAGLDHVDRADAVLLDRKMPGMTGDEVLEQIRRDGSEVPVAMVTAVDPDFDVVEMAFDDYLVKPIQREEVRSMVRTLLRRSEYDETIRDYYAVVSKIASLEAEKTDSELEAADEYTALQDRLTELRDEAQVVRDDTIRDGDVDGLFASLD